MNYNIGVLTVNIALLGQYEKRYYDTVSLFQPIYYDKKRSQLQDKIK
jgi:hypothetical protein